MKLLLCAFVHIFALLNQQVSELFNQLFFLMDVSVSLISRHELLSIRELLLNLLHFVTEILRLG